MADDSCLGEEELDLEVLSHEGFCLEAIGV